MEFIVSRHTLESIYNKSIKIYRNKFNKSQEKHPLLHKNDDDTFSKDEKEYWKVMLKREASFVDDLKRQETGILIN